MAIQTVTRDYPFDYYKIEENISPKDRLIVKIAKSPFILIKSIFQIIANIAIGVANLLQLYRLTKVEIIEPEAEPPLYDSVYKIIAISFIFSNAAKAIIGSGTLSSYSMKLNSFLQIFKAGPIENPVIGTPLLIGQLFFADKAFIKIPLALWTSFSVVKDSSYGILRCYNRMYENPAEAAKGAVFHITNIFAAISGFQHTYYDQPNS